MIIVIGLLAWLIAPVIELGVIIALALSNQKYKNQVIELKERLEQAKENPEYLIVERKEEAGVKTAKSAPPFVPMPAQSQGEAPSVKKPDQPVQPQTSLQPSEHGLRMAALIIGMIFIILAGLVFATTTWNHLPAPVRVLLLFALSGVFFGASLLAERLLGIHKTGNACYLLGMVFLFIAILAAAYLELLGLRFVLKGRNRWRVLLVGGLVTECAWSGGWRRFQDRLYTITGLWGLTMCWFFAAKSFEMQWHILISCLMVYAFLLVLLQTVLEKEGGGKAPQTEQTKEAGTDIRCLLRESLKLFVPLHFWTIGGLMAVVGFIEILLQMAGDIVSLSVPELFGLGALAVGAAALAGRKKRQPEIMLKELAAELFCSYLMFCLPLERCWKMLAASLAALVFLYVRSRKGKWCVTHTAWASFFAVFTYLMAFLDGNDLEQHGWRLGAVLVLFAVTYLWSQKVQRAKGLLPILLWFFVIMLPEGHSIVGTILLLSGFMVWDIRGKEDFSVPLLGIGTLSSLLFYGWGRDAAIPTLLLSAYLTGKGIGREPCKGQSWQLLAGSLYALAGGYFIMCHLTEHMLLRLVLVNLLFFLEIFSGSGVYGKLWGKRSLYWDICGCAVFGGLIGSFYESGEAALWQAGIIVLFFVVYYVWFYRGGRLWPHLLASLAILCLPAYLEEQKLLGEPMLYGLVGPFLIVTGLTARRFVPVVVWKKKPVQEEAVIGEEGGGLPERQVDWFHIGANFLLLLMALKGSREWRFLYTLFCAFYALLYASVPGLKKWAYTAAAGLVALAFWAPPFMDWPEVMRLKVQMALTWAWLFGLRNIWGQGQSVMYVQRTGFCICLGVLTLEAVFTEALADALFLEAVGLAVFLWAQRRQEAWWARVSGILIGLVAIFMTKGFWLSLSWWIYLLAAGIGLIAYAAYKERR